MKSGKQLLKEFKSNVTIAQVRDIIRRGKVQVMLERSPEFNNNVYIESYNALEFLLKEYDKLWEDYKRVVVPTIVTYPSYMDDFEGKSIDLST